MMNDGELFSFAVFFPMAAGQGLHDIPESIHMFYLTPSRPGRKSTVVVAVDQPSNEHIIEIGSIED